MSSLYFYPENQFIYPHPNQHVNFNFNNSIEEFRTARYVNNILKMFTPDGILHGIDINNISNNNNNLIIGINPGSLIQDSTLIKILYPFQVTLTNESYNPELNHFIIYTEFKFNSVTNIPTSDPQMFNIRVKAFNINNPIIEDWDIDINRIILHCAPINSPYDNLHEVLINDNLYVTRSTIKNRYDFNYTAIESVNLDGGVIN